MMRRMCDVATLVIKEFSYQLQWRFEIFGKFQWMSLVHPLKFDERRRTSPEEQRASIKNIKELYPFAFPDQVALKHNLSVLYNNK